MADVSYSVDIQVPTSSADAAAAAVDSLASSLDAAQFQAKAASEAAEAAAAKYTELQTAADKAAKAVERSAAKGNEGTAAHDALVAAASAAADRMNAAADAESAASEAAKEAADAADTLAEAQRSVALAAAQARDAEAGAAKAAQAQAQAFIKAAQAVENAKKQAAQKAQQEADKAAQTDMQQRKAMLKSSKEQFAIMAAGAAAVAAAVVALAVGFAHVVFSVIQLADKNKRLDAASAKLKKNFADLFGGLKIDKALDGLDSLVALFDTTTASGKAIKFLFEAMFQPIIDGIAAALPYIERFALLAVLYALKAYNALRPYKEEIMAVVTVLGVIAAVIAGVVIASIALFIGFIAAGIAIIVAIVAAIGLAVAWFYNLGSSIIDAIGSIDLMQIGSDMIAGLVDGIMGAAGSVLSAITGVVGGAIDAAKAALGISSPSKVFAEIGENTGAGMAKGVDAGAGEVQTSLESLVAPPDLAKGGAAGSGKGGAITGNTFNFYGVKDAEAGRDMYEDALTKILEGDALSAAA